MDDEKANRRRRSAAYVTSNACNECKKRKTKCDGEEPCSKCTASANLICRYEVSIQASKASLKAENHELHAYRQVSEHVFGSLAFDKQRDFILEASQDGKSLEDISHALRKQESKLDSSAWDFHATFHAEERRLGPSDSAAESSVQSSPVSSVSQSIRKDMAMEDVAQGNEPWTKVTTDGALIVQLMTLYFCWEYPIFASLSRPHFLADFQSGRRKFCSSLLVNTILAVGYQFLDESARTTNSAVSANDFSTEAERLLESEDGTPSLTTIQALGILSILEASRGRSEKSYFYCGQAIRMAVEMGLHLDSSVAHLSSTEREVSRATVWGTFTLDHAWSLILGRIPHLSLKGFAAAKPSVFEIEESIEWIPYTGPEQLNDNSLRQQSGVRSVYVALCDLFEVVHDSLYVLYAPGKALGSHEILNIYARYLTWYTALPPALRQGQNSTPQVFFLHMYYNFAILLLFGPFIRFRILSSGIVPFQMCVQAADAISSLLGAYGQLYSLRRTPSFMPIIALAGNIMDAVQAELQGSPNPRLYTGISTLQGLAYSHSFAKRRVEYLYILEQHRHLVAETPREFEASFHRYSRGSLSFVDAGVQDLPLDQADPFQTSIYAPFPTQVLPSALFKVELQKLGFEIVNTWSKGKNIT